MSGMRKTVECMSTRWGNDSKMKSRGSRPLRGTFTRENGLFSRLQLCEHMAKFARTVVLAAFAVKERTKNEKSKVFSKMNSMSKTGFTARKISGGSA